MPRRIRDFAPWIAIFLLVCGQNPVRAKGLSFDELRQRSLEIEKMPLIQRESLQRKWRTFQTLPPEKKDRYRQLHQDLEQDKQVGNQLNQTLQTYEAWLQTLAPGERAALRAATSPSDKLKLVLQIKADKDRRNQSRALSDPAEDGLRPRWRMFRRMAPPLTSAELSAAMEALAENLPAPDRDNLNRFDPQRDKWPRYRQIVLDGAKQAGGPQEWPNREQQAAIAAALPKSEAVLRLKALPDDQQRRGQWGRVIFSSFGEEIQKEQARFQPKPEDLAYLFEHLDSIERGKLMALPPEMQKEELIHKYYRDLRMENPEYRQRAEIEREFFTFYGQFMAQAAFFRGGGPGGPGRGGGRFGPPGPRDGRGDRDDPPRDRPFRDEGFFRRPPREGDRPPPSPDRPPPERPKDE